LYRMVRSLTGTLIDFDKNKKGPEDFKKILDAKERSMAGPTAPPEGLFLWQVKFDGIRRHA
ncbi:MAG: tRNA pseudouridine(38-40) synthase TruA, partial [Treponema sp.]|nr:tRNA pseudouridine(38-40) synthase TruA [Treponema sp.]